MIPKHLQCQVYMAKLFLNTVNGGVSGICRAAVCYVAEWYGISSAKPPSWTAHFQKSIPARPLSYQLPTPEHCWIKNLIHEEVNSLNVLFVCFPAIVCTNQGHECNLSRKCQCTCNSTPAWATRLSHQCEEDTGAADHREWLFFVGL